MNLAPFCTWLTPNADMSSSDIQQEISRLYQRQKAIDAMLHGELDFDTVADMLMEHCIDPNEWAETSIANVEFLMGQRF